MLPYNLRLLTKGISGKELINKTVYFSEKLKIQKARKTLKSSSAGKHQLAGMKKDVDVARKSNAQRIGIKFIRRNGRIIPIRPKRKK